MPEWKGKTRGGTAGYQILIWIMKHCGIHTVYAIVKYVVVPYFIPFAPKATAASWFYWRQIHHKSILKSFRMLFVHYYAFAQVLIDKIATLSGIDKKKTYDFKNYQTFLDLLNSGKGVVMIGAHFGNWEIGSQFFGNYAHKLNIVMYDVEYKKIKDKVEKETGGRSYKVIAVSRHDDLDSIFKIKAALNNGEYVCFQGDRYINEDKLLEHNFLGKKAKFPAGPFMVASRLHLPVVFYFCEKENKDKYSFNFSFAQEIIREKSKGKPEEQLLDQYIATLENEIAKHPEQWFNFYAFWEK